MGRGIPAAFNQRRLKKGGHHLRTAGKASAAPAPVSEPEAEPSVSMENTRAELNEAALALGIENPDQLANKQAVLDAILAV